MEMNTIHNAMAIIHWDMTNMKKSLFIPCWHCLQNSSTPKWLHSCGVPGEPRRMCPHNTKIRSRNSLPLSTPNPPPTHPESPHTLLGIFSHHQSRHGPSSSLDQGNRQWNWTFKMSTASMLQSFTLNYMIHNDNTHILKYRVNQKLIQRQLVSSMGTFLRRCTDGQRRECQCALARGQYQLPRCYWQSRGVIVCWQGGQCRVLVTLLFLLCYW